MPDQEKSNLNEKENKQNTGNNMQNTMFEAAEDDNILDRTKRGLAKLSWFQKLFK